MHWRGGLGWAHRSMQGGLAVPAMVGGTPGKIPEGQGVGGGAWCSLEKSVRRKQNDSAGANICTNTKSMRCPKRPKHACQTHTTHTHSSLPSPTSPRGKQPKADGQIWSPSDGRESTRFQAAASDHFAAWGAVVVLGNRSLSQHNPPPIKLEKFPHETNVGWGGGCQVKNGWVVGFKKSTQVCCFVKVLLATASPFPFSPFLLVWRPARILPPLPRRRQPKNPPLSIVSKKSSVEKQNFRDHETRGDIEGRGGDHPNAGGLSHEKSWRGRSTGQVHARNSPGRKKKDGPK